jgi:hypothetical protein
MTPVHTLPLSYQYSTASYHLFIHFYIHILLVMMYRYLPMTPAHTLSLSYQYKIFTHGTSPHNATQLPVQQSFVSLLYTFLHTFFACYLYAPPKSEIRVSDYTIDDFRWGDNKDWSTHGTWYSPRISSVNIMFHGLINPCIHRNWKSLTVLLYDIKSNLN